MSKETPWGRGRGRGRVSFQRMKTHKLLSTTEKTTQDPYRKNILKK